MALYRFCIGEMPVYLWCSVLQIALFDQKLYLAMEKVLIVVIQALPNIIRAFRGEKSRWTKKKEVCHEVHGEDGAELREKS